MEGVLSHDEILRLSCTLKNTATAIFMLTPELDITYLNSASANLLQKYTDEFSTVYSDFDPERIEGLNLKTMGIFRIAVLERLENPSKLPYAKFVDVGNEKFHFTINPLYADDGRFIGSAGEWWWATEYLHGLEDTRKITDIGSILDVVDDITIQNEILSMNAAVQAAGAGMHGDSFGIIAREMRELSRRSRNALNEIKTSFTN
jgi:PAS domain-containing protein